MTPGSVQWGRRCAANGKRLLPLVLLCCSFAGNAAGLSGVVRDGGEPVAGLTLTLITMPSRTVAESTSTGAGGGYHFELRPGRYRLRVSGGEYADTWSGSFEVGGNAVTLNMSVVPAVFEDERYVPASDDCE